MSTQNEAVEGVAGGATFAQQAVAVGLRKMFRNGGYFDICAVRSCLAAAKIEAPRSEMEALHPLHCVDWKDMTPEFRQEVMDRTLALFRHPSFDVDALMASIAPPSKPTPVRLVAVVPDEPSPQPKRGFVRRLLSGAPSPDGPFGRGEK